MMTVFSRALRKGVRVAQIQRAVPVIRPLETIMRRRTVSVGFALLAIAAACGGSDSTSPNNTNNQHVTNGTFTAQINGTTWNAIGTASVTKSSSNFLVFSGAGPFGATTYALSFAIGGATGAGTYSLTYLNQSASTLIVVSPSNTWSSYVNGGSGTLTLTTLTANHIVGTFSADVAPGSSTTTGTLQIRNGQFDLTF
jgi:hypothetical protein